jgi:hypothetical protein
MLVAGVLVFSSCRTTRDLPMVEVRPVTTARLLRNIEQNAFDYEYFTVRRINCQYSGNDTKVNFRITLKAHKDKKILVSISKLNIAVGSVLLTPDSVKYVNYMERNFFLDDYSYLSKVLNVDLDFETIQSILSNNIFSYRNDPGNRDFRNFESAIEEGQYVLFSEKEHKIERMEERAVKLDRRIKKPDADAFILQKMFFEPLNFALTRLLIDDKTNSRKLELFFADFEKINDKNYPGSIDMFFTSPQDQISLKLKMSGFSDEKIDSFSLNIPEKYEQIRVN